MKPAALIIVLSMAATTAIAGDLSPTGDDALTLATWNKRNDISSDAVWKMMTSPSMACRPEGDCLIAFRRTFVNSSGRYESGVFGLQVNSITGHPIGTEFRIDQGTPQTTGNRVLVGYLAARGSYVVFFKDIFEFNPWAMREVDANNGQPIGGTTRIDRRGGSGEEAIACQADGCVLTWTARVVDTQMQSNISKLYSQYIDANAQPQGDAIALHQSAGWTFSLTSEPPLALLPTTNGYALAWHEAGELFGTPGKDRILLQQLNATGNPAGEAKVVHETDSYYQPQYAAVARNPDTGDFLVSWVEFDRDARGEDSRLRGILLDADSEALMPFEIGTRSQKGDGYSRWISKPDVLWSAASRSYIAAWGEYIPLTPPITYTNGTFTTGQRAFIQRISADAVPQGTPVMLGNGEWQGRHTSSASYVSLGASPEGSMLVAWQSWPYSSMIQARVVVDNGSVDAPKPPAPTPDDPTPAPPPAEIELELRNAGHSPVVNVTVRNLGEITLNNTAVSVSVRDGSLPTGVGYGFQSRGCTGSTECAIGELSPGAVFNTVLKPSSTREPFTVTLRVEVTGTTTEGLPHTIFFPITVRWEPANDLLRNVTLSAQADARTGRVTARIANNGAASTPAMRVSMAFGDFDPVPYRATSGCRMLDDAPACETTTLAARRSASVILDPVDSMRPLSGTLRLALRPANDPEAYEHTFDVPVTYTPPGVGDLRVTSRFNAGDGSVTLQVNNPTAITLSGVRANHSVTGYETSPYQPASGCSPQTGGDCALPALAPRRTTTVIFRPANPSKAITGRFQLRLAPPGDPAAQGEVASATHDLQIDYRPPGLRDLQVAPQFNASNGRVTIRITNPTNQALSGLRVAFGVDGIEGIPYRVVSGCSVQASGLCDVATLASRRAVTLVFEPVHAQQAIEGHFRLRLMSAFDEEEPGVEHRLAINYQPATVEQLQIATSFDARDGSVSLRLTNPAATPLGALRVEYDLDGHSPNPYRAVSGCRAQGDGTCLTGAIAAKRTLALAFRPVNPRQPLAGRFTVRLLLASDPEGPAAVLTVPVQFMQ